MISIEEMYKFSSTVRKRFATKLAELPWDQVSKNREASFYSMKNILVHMIECEDRIVNWVIRDKGQLYENKRYDNYTSMKMVMDYMKEVQDRTRIFLSTLNEDELARKVDFVTSSGKVFKLSVEECLFQAFTEQLYHLGELIALLWQDDIEPPPMTWYRNNPREFSIF